MLQLRERTPFLAFADYGARNIRGNLSPLNCWKIENMTTTHQFVMTSYKKTIALTLKRTPQSSDKLDKTHEYDKS